MFKLTKSPTVSTDVSISTVNAVGVWKTETVKATYKRVSTEELEGDLRSLKPREVLNRVLVRVDDLFDESEQPIEWSDEVKDALLAIPGAVTGLAEKFWSIQCRVAEKR